MCKAFFVNVMLLNCKLLRKLGLSTKKLPDSYLDLKHLIFGGLE